MRRLGRQPALLFPSAMVANADPNALDDYEELTFTPTLTFGGSLTGITYGTGGQVGRCTKIGRHVHVEGRIILTSKGTLTTGAPTISGLPFAGLSLVSAGPFRYLNVSLTTGTILGGYVNGSVIQLQTMGASGCADLTPSLVSNTTDIMFAADYATA
jgi:hypothetical protein